MNANLLIRAHAVVEQLKASGQSLSLAESCTGGMIAAALTSIPGASSALQFGWICYSAQAKHLQLGLDLDLVEQHGVVSEQVAAAMAEGALVKASSDIALSITGNAGPTAELGEAPVGSVYIGIARKGQASQVYHLCWTGMERNAWRERVAMQALDFLYPHIS